ncbi:MAG: amino acid ABC transporter substrate-binding protein [Gammaproteobacteria bacterium]|nr:amino acid ABC transporter substrate-binding protein [Gammaproteobacteria bacterium]
MLRYFCILIVFYLSVSKAILAEEIEVVIWVNDSHPPYTYEKDGKAMGIYIEVMEKISQRMNGYTMKFNPAPWQRVKKEIKRGNAFAFMPPYYHGHDWEYIWPYSLPIMEEKVVLVCRNEILETPRPNWPDDYLGLLIGNNTGYDGFGGPRFRQYVSEGKMALQELKTTEQNILTLVKGRSDCYMVNHFSFIMEKKQLIESGRVNADAMQKIKLGPVISADAVYMGFTDRDNGKFDFKKDFHQKINNELYKMQKSDEIRKIADQFLK